LSTPFPGPSVARFIQSCAKPVTSKTTTSGDTPLRVADAAVLAAAVTSTRAGEPEPDRVALASALRRVSHLAVDLEARIEKIELGRIVSGARGGRTMVIDAAIELSDE
jgi:hypothetical protein